MTAYELLRDFYVNLPHSRQIGLTFVRAENDVQVLSAPWRQEWTGDANTGVIHGGVITTLVDVACATAVAAKLTELETLATLDLRIDYLHPARPKEPVFARAHCVQLSSQVGFVRAVCYQDEDNPLALGTAAFMRTPLTPALQALAAAYSVAPGSDHLEPK